VTATNTVDTYDYYDGFNRLVQERKASQTAGTYVATDRLYNPVGLLGSTSLPYFSSGSGFTSPTSISALYTAYTYDPLKRALITSNAVGQTKNVYTKWTTTTTDPNGNIKDYMLDAFGNLANVVEHGFTLATTTYTYDAANNLATTTDSQGNVRAFTYDGLNRRLTAQDLHVAADTTFGVWLYSYDDAGNMISQVDPKGATTTRTYDALGRLLTETNAGATQATNTYDSCTNGIGYLCVASSTASKTQNAFDILGRISYGTTTIAGLAFTSSSTYDRQGNITNFTYPNGSQVSYTYNLAGQVSNMQTKSSGGSWASIASSLAYAPQGLVNSELFGNGASSTWSFNSNAIYRLATLQTQGQGGTTIQNFAYTYDPVGNLTQIANTASTTNSATVIYGYDSLNRLTVATTTATAGTPYAQYDTLGNLLTIALGATTTQPSAYPTILDTLPLAIYQTPVGSSDSRSYAVPAGGSNKLFLVLLTNGSLTAPTATLNGASLTFVSIGTANRAIYFVGYLANPTSGTFTMNWSPNANSDYTLLTVKDAAQTNPIDVSNVTTVNPGTTLTTSVTTTQGNDLLLSFPVGSSASPTFSGFGAGETLTISSQNPQFGPSTGSYKNAAATAGSESMTINTSASQQMDEPVVAVKAYSGPALPAATTTTYVYAQTGFANPDAVTQISTMGVSTTTYSYDPNGNLIQAGGWSYMWDYLNRMLASGYNNSTTTYAYDPSGARVLQTSTTSTTYYPNKYYSFTSTKIGANTYATSTNYIWNGDTLLATVDQRLYNGTATGSPITRYVHPDHLGSTNVVTDQNGNVVQLMDYYPYGASRIATSTYPTNEKRQYIGQFSDVQTSLNYLNARYYNSQQGQFISQDPEFWGTAQHLRNPQSLNAYAYSLDNPITRKDPSGNAPAPSPPGTSNGTAEIHALVAAGFFSTSYPSVAVPGAGVVSHEQYVAMNSLNKGAFNGLNTFSLNPNAAKGMAIGAAAVGAGALTITGLGILATPEALGTTGAATALCEKYCPEATSEGSQVESAGSSEAGALAKSIANGHAAKHISDLGSMGITDAETFANEIQSTMSNPSASFIGFNGQTYYWGENGLFVVTGNGIESGGSAFAPNGGFSYFLRQFATYRQ
jgi:RHS repeat-associated protein